jgi:protein TonB
VKLALAIASLLLAASAGDARAQAVRIRPADATWAGPRPAPATGSLAPLSTTRADPLAHLPLQPRGAGAEVARAAPPAPPPTPKFRREKVEVAPPPPPVEAAETIDAPAPEYPRTARRKRQEGTVTLLADVRADGTVASCRIETSSGFPLLDAAAQAVLPSWRFKPRVVAGNAQPFVARVPFRFTLGGGAPR